MTTRKTPGMDRCATLLAELAAEQPRWAELFGAGVGEAAGKFFATQKKSLDDLRRVVRGGRLGSRTLPKFTLDTTETAQKTTPNALLCVVGITLNVRRTGILRKSP